MSSVNNTDMTTAGIPSSVKGAMDNAENTGNFYATAFYKIKTDTLGSSFKAIADYADRKGGSYLFSDAFYYDANGDVAGRNNYTQDLPSNTKVYTVRADFDKKTSTATSYSFGAKYANSSINSDSYYRINDNGQWRDDDSRSTRYRLRKDEHEVLGQPDNDRSESGRNVALQLFTDDGTRRPAIVRRLFPVGIAYEAVR